MGGQYSRQLLLPEILRRSKSIKGAITKMGEIKKVKQEYQK